MQHLWKANKPKYMWKANIYESQSKWCRNNSREFHRSALSVFLKETNLMNGDHKTPFTPQPCKPGWTLKGI